MFKVQTLIAGVFAAGLFFAAGPASAAPIGVGAVPEATATVLEVQYGYGGPRFGPRYGYGHRGYGRPHFRGRGYGYGRGYGHRHRHGFGGYGRPGIF